MSTNSPGIVRANSGSGSLILIGEFSVALKPDVMLATTFGFNQKVERTSESFLEDCDMASFVQIS